jgi:hypothetical protein
VAGVGLGGGGAAGLHTVVAAAATADAAVVPRTIQDEILLEVSYAFCE